MKKLQFVYVLAVKMKKDLFKDFEGMVSDRFAKQSELVSFATSYEHLSGFGSIVVTAGAEIDVDIITSIEVLIKLFDLKDYYTAWNNTPSVPNTPLYYFVKVIKVDTDHTMVMQAIEQSLMPWLFTQPSIYYEIGKIGNEYIYFACFHSLPLVSNMINRVNTKTKEHLVLLSLDS